MLLENYRQQYTLAGEHARARSFEVGGAVGRAALAARKAGRRKAFEAAGCQLDVATWGSISDGVMWRALQWSGIALHL